MYYGNPWGSLNGPESARQFVSLYDSTFSRTVWRLYGGAKGLVMWYCPTVVVEVVRRPVRAAVGAPAVVVGRGRRAGPTEDQRIRASAVRGATGKEAPVRPTRARLHRLRPRPLRRRRRRLIGGVRVVPHAAIEWQRGEAAAPGLLRTADEEAPRPAHVAWPLHTSGACTAVWCSAVSLMSVTAGGFVHFAPSSQVWEVAGTRAAR
jgi:hypothetical protein